MPIVCLQWHVGTETFHGWMLFSTAKRACCDSIITFKYFFIFFHSSFLSILALKAGDITFLLLPLECK